MPPINVVRWVLLAMGIFGVLAGTVLFRVIYAATIEPYLRLAERLGRPLPRTGPVGAMFRNHKLLRAWNLVFGLVYIALWWYLGTHAGAAMWTHAGAP
ncbi:MAG TPA: hypothetical protein VFJ74_16490 [Gemmatimonadaceae bacterium]|nr:hypothetical protein [Gemmatimonadaceae bacterium]